MNTKLILSLTILGFVQVLAKPKIASAVAGQQKPSPHFGPQDAYMHPHIKASNPIKKYDLEEETAEFWRGLSRSTLTEKLIANQLRTGVAKNVIMFLGDGMSVPTVSATRAYLGQRNGKTGEETVLSFDKFTFTGLSKTYCVDAQVPDSACTATAYLCGVKANEATIGVTAAVPIGECDPMTNTSNHVDSIARLSQLAGKRTGVVTTTRITHASPAGVYAHTAHRDWESDSDVESFGVDPKKCRDIAYQLVHGETGENLNVILGGGHGGFLPNTETDVSGEKGKRNDGLNLVNDWNTKKEGTVHKFVTNKNDLLSATDDTEFLFGLFHSSHLPYNLQRDDSKEPSLSEMTQTAIRLLSKEEKGYFLFVEGGRIDHAHHDTKTRHALEETVEFHKAIQAAVEATNIDDTLIIVTSDHAHTMTFNGYPKRGNDILGLVGHEADDGMSYTTLSYANGPGYRAEVNGVRRDMSKENLASFDLQYPAMVPIYSETHGGDDVAIFAQGPWAHLLTGVVEQNFIPTVMSYASCVGDGETACKGDNSNEPDGAGSLSLSLINYLVLLLILILQYCCLL